MGSKSLYLRVFAEDEGENVIEMRKFTPDLEPADTYTLRVAHTGETICNCPARQVECRHVKMQEIFDRADKGQDHLYNEMRWPKGEGEGDDHPEHVVYLMYDGKMYQWVQGPEIVEAS